MKEKLKLFSIKYFLDEDDMFSNRYARQRSNKDSNSNQRRSTQNTRNSNNLMQVLFGDFPIGGMNGFGPSLTSFSSFSSGSGGPAMRSTSKSTKIINGKKFVTTK